MTQPSRESRFSSMLSFRMGMVSLLALGVGSPWAEAAPGYVPESLLLTSQSMNSEVVRIMDPNTMKIVYDFDLRKDSFEGCDTQELFCGPIGAEHRLVNGDDVLDVAVYMSNASPNATKVENLHSVITRIRPVKPAQVIWTLKSLDWSDIPELAELCAMAPDAPFEDTDVKCAMIMVHKVQVVDDRPDDQSVTVMMADLLGEKILQVTLDYAGGNTRGHVDWILNGLNPSWPLKGSPNTVQYIPDMPGGPYLLATYYTEVPQPYGAGGLVMWQWNGRGWNHAWSFPEPGSSDLPYLNTPHMALYQEDPLTGQGWITYNHSRALAGDWGSYTQLGGSYGWLEPGPTLADPPTYVGDMVVHRADARNMTHFSRDFDILPDGTWLLTDSGCENPAFCTNTARVFRVNPFTLPSSVSGKSGAYAPDFSRLNVVDIPDAQVEQELQCGFYILFESQWLESDAVGPTLRNAAATTTTPCPRPGRPSGPGL